VVTRFPRIAVNGSQLSRLDFQLSRDYLMLAVDFHPGILHHFLRRTLSEAFIDERIDGGALLGSGIEQLHEQMANAERYDRIIALFEEYLWRRIKQIRFELSPLDRLCRFVSQRPSALSVEQMASEACLSISQLERRFAQQIGISPKLFARTCRFYQAFQLKDQHPDLDWLSVALQTGYSDYQHLVKDFKQFAGTTPASLLEAQARAPERILGLD
jgi:AraC-like DNA-binding protein